MPAIRELYQLYLHIHDVSLLADRVFDRLVKPVVGITRPQLWVLFNLNLNQGEGMTQIELARHLQINPVGLGKMIDRMEKTGTLRRVPNPDDRRAKRILIGARGRKLLKTIDGLDVLHKGLAVSHIPAGGVRNLNRLLQALRESLSEVLERPPPPAAPKRRSAVR